MSHEKADFYKVVYPAFRFAIDRKFDSTVINPENVLEQPAIYAANHIRFEDSFLVARAYTETTGDPLRFAAKQEYFDGLGLDDKGKYGRSVKWLMEHTRMIPVDRESKDPHSFNNFQNTIGKRIARGDSVALHPEGTRSEDGKLHKFKSGASRIAIALSVPIVPVGLVYEDYSNGQKTHVDVIFGRAIMPEAYTRIPYTLIPGQKHKAEHLIKVVEDRVSDLTGMKQSGKFAELKKHRRSGEQLE